MNNKKSKWAPLKAGDKIAILGPSIAIDSHEALQKYKDYISDLGFIPAL